MSDPQQPYQRLKSSLERFTPEVQRAADFSRRGPFLFLVGLLIILGLGAATVRHELYGIPWVPGEQTQIWQIDARIEFNAQEAPARVKLALPPPQNGFEILSEAPASAGWGFAVEYSGDAEQEERHALWSQRNASGRQVLFYKLAVATATQDVVTAPPDEVVAPTWDEPYETAVNDLLGNVYPVSADAHTLTVQLIKAINRGDANQTANLLTSNYPRHELIIRILNTAGVAARAAQVLPLEDGRRRQNVTAMLQVWDGGQWQLYDPYSGSPSRPVDQLIWSTGTSGVLEVSGGNNSRVQFSMLQETQSTTVLAQEQAGDLALSLYNLPIAEQGMFKLIMLLPVGAFVVALLRVLVGLRTSGTFMPVLIALSFLQTELIPGLLSFIIVVAIGLLIRSYLSSLNLLLVARIAVLVILVIGIISVFSIVSFRLGLIGGLTITFFPMIILAWTIERMSITWEEEGPREVVIQGGGSLLVAVIAFLIMRIPTVEHLVFHFPELHLVLLAAILLLGRYTGYRLLELRRFASLDNA